MLLARRGLKVKVKDKDGMTPLALADAFGHAEIAALIREHIILPVAFRGENVATTWGRIKAER